MNSRKILTLAESEKSWDIFFGFKKGTEERRLLSQLFFTSCEYNEMESEDYNTTHGLVIHNELEDRLLKAIKKALKYGFTKEKILSLGVDPYFLQEV